jgi:uncharacterized membrane protein
MKRAELDAFVAHHGLSRSDVEAALELTDARPSAAELRSVLVRMLNLGGLLSIAAGIIFFIAANWALFAVFGRFALVEALLAVAVGQALWKPPPQAVGRFALLAAFILTGTLLALFGQTYQTGANIYELFLTWTVLGLLFAVAAHWSVVWAAWVLVLNLALALYCGWRPEGGLLYVLIPAASVDSPLALLIAMGVNLLLWFAVEMNQQRATVAAVTPRWLRRLLLTFAIAFGTWSGIVALADAGYGMSRISGSGVAALIVLALLFAGIAAHVLRRRDDVFPLAGIAASVIVLGAIFLVTFLRMRDQTALLVLAVWLIGSSTILGRLLMRYVRAWRAARTMA